MSAAQKLRAVPAVDPVAAARALVESTAKAARTAEADFANAKQAEAEALRAYADDPSKREGKRAATDARERAELLVDDAKKEEARARTDLEALERAEIMRRYDAAIERARTWTHRLGDVFAHVAAARAELLKAQEAAADLVVDQHASFDEAARIAEEHGKLADLRSRVERVGIGTVKSLVQVRNALAPDANELANGWGESWSRPPFGAANRDFWDSLERLFTKQ